MELMSNAAADSPRTFFVPQALLCLLCFQVGLAVQTTCFNVRSAGRLAGHQQHTISRDLISAHELDNLTRHNLCENE
jgi:hypothetical protein